MQVLHIFIIFPNILFNVLLCLEIIKTSISCLELKKDLIVTNIVYLTIIILNLIIINIFIKMGKKI